MTDQVDLNALVYDYIKSNVSDDLAKKFKKSSNLKAELPKGSATIKDMVDFFQKNRGEKRKSDGQVNGVSKAKKAKKDDSSSEDSDSDSDEEEEKKPKVNGKAKKEESSSDDDSSEEEEEKPKVNGKAKATPKKKVIMGYKQNT